MDHTNRGHRRARPLSIQAAEAAITIGWARRSPKRSPAFSFQADILTLCSSDPRSRFGVTADARELHFPRNQRGNFQRPFLGLRPLVLPWCCLPKAGPCPQFWPGPGIFPFADPFSFSVNKHKKQFRDYLHGEKKPRSVQRFISVPGPLAYRKR